MCDETIVADNSVTPPCGARSGEPSIFMHAKLLRRPGHTRDTGARLARVGVMLRTDTPGFEGVLSGTTIHDLIQMSCLSLSTRAVRVEAQGREGRVFLGGGQVVHAETRTAEGEEALFDMLTWTHGRFSIEEGRSPRGETITRMWQSLLLEAAYRLDESRRFAAAHEGRMGEMEMSAPSARQGVPEVKAWVRFKVQGETLAGRATDIEELQSSWAYAVELSRAMGQVLGLEALSSIEARAPADRAVCRVRVDEVLVVIAGPGTDVGLVADAAERGEL
jgi:hypothetical protein